MKKYTVRLIAAEAPMSMFRDSEVDARASMLSACEPSIASWLTWKASERQERRPASLYAAIMTAYDAAKAQVVLKDQHIELRRQAGPSGGRDVAADETNSLRFFFFATQASGGVRMWRPTSKTECKAGVARLVSFLAVRFGSTVRCERIVGSAGLSSK